MVVAVEKLALVTAGIIDDTASQFGAVGTIYDNRTELLP